MAQPASVNTSVALLQLQSMPGVPKPLAGRLTVAVRYAALENAAEAERLLAPMRVAGHASDVVAATAPWSTGEQFSNFAPSSDPGRAALLRRGHPALADGARRTLRPSRRAGHRAGGALSTVTSCNDAAEQAIWRSTADMGNLALPDAGWSSSVARWAHNPEVAGSNPVPATR